MFSRKALKLKYKDIISTDWSNFTAGVDGVILPAGKNWANGTNQGSFVCASVLLSVNYGIRSISTRIGYDHKEDILYLFLDPKTANYMASSQEISDHIRYNAVMLDEHPRNAVWGLKDIIYGTNIIVIDDAHMVEDRFEYDMKEGEAYLFVAKPNDKDNLIPGFKFTDCIT